MDDSAPESAEDNGNSVHIDYPEVMNEVTDANSMENVSVNGSLPDDDYEESVGSPQQSNYNSDSLRVESPGGSVHLTRKGFGLKKWRRIKRDGPVKDETVAVDCSKLLKRGLTGSINPPSKHVDLSSVDARQSSEGSVGSVNMMHHPGLANGFSPNPDCVFAVGQTEEHSSNSIGAQNIGGKIVSSSLYEGKSNGERVKAEKEKPCSSMDSEFGCSDFVFSSGAVSVAKDENHSEEYGKDGQFSEEVQGHSRSENGEQVDGNVNKKKHHSWADKDPLADSIRSLAAVQEAIWKEVQSFQELGKEFNPLHSNIIEENSTSTGSQVLILKQKEKDLETKLEEVRSILELKEARIQELENSKIESELEGIFQRKIETEIEHLMLTRSLKSLQVLKQPKKVHSLTEGPEPNREDILGKTCKFGLCFLTQIVLLVSILRYLILRFSPASRLVTPT